MHTALQTLYDYPIQGLDGIENKEYSFDFNQGYALLHKLKDIIPEIAEVLMTNSDKENAKNLFKGLCFGLSTRYLMEERIHGPGGGRDYMPMLEYIVDQYSKINLMIFNAFWLTCVQYPGVYIVSS
ncbi:MULTISPECIES: hypothetical protein [Candidatus Williamhamiltonella]|uniref:Uncharacterized protein n=1 Tax=Candidatus Williamhamiltonella defendens TaxID=138072 RepID=A0A2D3TCV0_9ENTR|nr:hypothetical protein [Candidatus Hamiltonella defensa]ATW33598.1 hypothetical protein BJP43_04105 [Candidatus Hamiltonella defensa]AYB48362.1 hypothetical protein CJJ19_01245 [Candidatus Hamiltonella defensa]